MGCPTGLPSLSARGFALVFFVSSTWNTGLWLLGAEGWVCFLLF